MTIRPPRFSPPDHVMSQRLGDGGIVINLETDRVFELNGSAALIWELICEYGDEERLIQGLESRFHGSARVLEAETSALIQGLLREGLLKRV